MLRKYEIYDVRQSPFRIHLDCYYFVIYFRYKTRFVLFDLVCNFQTRWPKAANLYYSTAIFVYNSLQLHTGLDKLNMAFTFEADQKLWQFHEFKMATGGHLEFNSNHSKNFTISIMDFHTLQNFLNILTCCTTLYHNISHELFISTYHH